MTLLTLGVDANGRQTFLRPTSANVYSGLLALGVEQTLTIPTGINTTSGKWDVILSYGPGAVVWVAINGTAVAPTTTIASSTSELNPVGYTRLKTGDVIHLITTDTNAYVGVTMYELQ